MLEGSFFFSIDMRRASHSLFPFRAFQTEDNTTAPVASDHIFSIYLLCLSPFF